MCCLQGQCNNLLLLALFSYLYNKVETNNNSCTYTFKISDFKKFIGYVGGSKSWDIKAELLKLSKVGYVWQYVPEDKVIEVTFNDTGTIATVRSSYLYNVYKHMAKFKAVRNKWGKLYEKGRSSYSSQVFTSILKERNTSAVEIVVELVKLIERRGPLEQGQTAHISMLSLVERCSTLYHQLQTKPAKEQNRIIRSALYKSLDLMKIHTDMYNSFEGLEFILPEQIRYSSDSVLNIKYVRRNVEC